MHPAVSTKKTTVFKFGLGIVASLTQAVGVSSFHKTLLVHAETAAEMAGSTWKAHIESNPSLPPQIHCKAIVPTASEGIPHRNACLEPAETKNEHYAETKTTRSLAVCCACIVLPCLGSAEPPSLLYPPASSQPLSLPEVRDILEKRKIGSKDKALFGYALFCHCWCQ